MKFKLEMSKVILIFGSFEIAFIHRRPNDACHKRTFERSGVLVEYNFHIHEFSDTVKTKMYSKWQHFPDYILTSCLHTVSTRNFE